MIQCILLKFRLQNFWIKEVLRLNMLRLYTCDFFLGVVGIKSQTLRKFRRTIGFLFGS